MAYQIRPARADELDAMLALFPRLAAFPLPPQRRAEDTWQGDAALLRAWSTGALPQCTVLVAAADDGHVLGLAMAQLREELLSHAPSAHLEVLAVHAAAEGQGIGTALVAAMEQAVRQRGAHSMTLHVFANNTRARAVYERHGYDGELVRYIKHFE